MRPHLIGKSHTEISWSTRFAHSKKYLSVVIKLTAGDHVTSNMKYKYVTALEYAFANNVQSENLRAFIKQQGGLNKCVELWNKKYGGRPRKKRRKNNP